MKTDWLHEGLKLVDYNRYVVIALVMMVAMIAYSAGCQSKTTALTPDETGTFGQVDRDQFEREALDAQSQLKAEYAALEAKAKVLIQQIELGEAHLDKQDQIKAQILGALGEIVVSVASGQVTTAACVTGAVTISSVLLGLGALADKRRTDIVLEDYKDNMVGFFPNEELPPGEPENTPV